MMRIKRARSEHAAVLSEIAFRAKRYWGYPERWMERWREELTVEPEFISSHETYAALRGGHILGFYALRRKGEGLDWLHLWVLPEAMGRGIGRSLFLHALGRVKALGYRKLQIESDPNAEVFYQRMGARRIGLSVREVEQQRRELPILVYEINDGG